MLNFKCNKKEENQCLCSALIPKYVAENISYADTQEN